MTKYIRISTLPEVKFKQTVNASEDCIEIHPSLMHTILSSVHSPNYIDIFKEN